MGAFGTPLRYACAVFLRLTQVNGNDLQQRAPQVPLQQPSA